MYIKWLFVITNLVRREQVLNVFLSKFIISCCMVIFTVFSIYGFKVDFGSWDVL